MIQGFLEQVRADLIVGWAFDTEDPERSLDIDIFLGDRHVAALGTDVFRGDLALHLGSGGRHGFKYVPVPEIERQRLFEVTVRVGAGGNPAAGVELPRFVPKHLQPKKVEFERRLSAAAFRDESQAPVFILGSPRSGTSAVASSFMRGSSLKGRYEGHVLDLLAPLLRALRGFYDSKAVILQLPEEHMLIRSLPESYFASGICALFNDALRGIFPEHRWFDKTPTPDMIWAAPELARMWPRARFIFCKRRGLENLESRRRKFKNHTFEYGCQDWAACMEAWLSVRSALAGKALEIDQYLLARRPEEAGAAISELVGFDEREAEVFCKVLASQRPERTSSSIQDVCDPALLDWSSERWDFFDTVCGSLMKAYGYSRDGAYYLPGEAARALVKV
jgi:hypothetical protein